ncbi:MAG: glycosyltransferase [Pyrinomonadaceae bacterium]|nr:glycosyltransferase [Pyrinomonadaceae bacterium]
MLSGKSLICFGGEDWWYHHPHSKNHLMRRFARAGNKVVFVNSISMGLPGLANKDLLPRVARKLRSYAKLARTTPEGITVVSPATLPFFGSRAARAVNRHLLAAQINLLARSRNLSRPILWIAIPTAAEMIGRLDESLVIYHVSDKYDANTMDHATNPAAIRRLHEIALDKADLIFYSGRKLYDEAERGREHSYLLEQAVDFEHWASVTGGSLKVAPEVAALPRPRLGYFGAIEPWLVDQELIKQAAKKHPAWQWVFIGNKARGMEIENLPNTHFLPPVAYDDLPRYAAGFDVCVLPWETEQAFTSYGSAIKVREYLATGKPTVIAPLPEYEPMKNVLRIARSREDFFRQVEDALQETGTEAARARQAAVAGGTWDARAEWVSELIEETEDRSQESGVRSQESE